MAYGHFPKAIAMIEEALQTAPEALPLQMKLLEIYAESKDLDLFQATEVKLRGGDLDDEALAYINGLRQELGLRPGNGPVKEADVGFGEEETEFVSEFTQAPDEPEETAVSGKVEDEQDDLLSLADIEAELDMGYEFDEDDSQPDLGAAASSAVSSTNFNEELTVTSDFQEEGTAENRFIAEETNVHLDDELDLSSGELNFSFEETSVPEDDLEDFSPDDALADIDQEIGGLGKEAAVQEMASQENKLNISMEIDGMGSVIEEDPDAGFSLDEEAVASGPALSSEDESLLEGVDEVGTKLDLATAYIDMGDHEGAKDILDEVMLEGNEDQQQKARELMSRVG